MDGIAARDPRVLAILTAPDAYFDDARRRAWRMARRDIAMDLDRRARRRNGLFGNHHNSHREGASGGPEASSPS